MWSTQKIGLSLFLKHIVRRTFKHSKLFIILVSTGFVQLTLMLLI